MNFYIIYNNALFTLDKRIKSCNQAIKAAFNGKDIEGYKYWEQERVKASQLHYKIQSRRDSRGLH